jgi:triosephosphate isomerase (TIM)
LRYFIINTKNYLDQTDQKLDRLAKVVRDIARSKEFTGMVEFSLAVPAFSLGLIAEKFPGLNVLAQHLDAAAPGASTGFLVPEVAKSFGALGTLVNHSEHRLETTEIEKIVYKLRSLTLTSVVCAKDEQEVAYFAALAPSFIAVEPPELIGTGIAVSSARPELISNSKKSLVTSAPEGADTKLLCGAGIVDGKDAARAVELGAEGILVATGVVKAQDWSSKIEELARSLAYAKRTEEC